MAGWSTQNVTNFIFAFTLPYLSGPSAPSADLGAKVAFIYSALGWMGVVWAYFFVPELKDRSLEEIDEMLRLKVPARKTKGGFCLFLLHSPLAYFRSGADSFISCCSVAT